MKVQLVAPTLWQPMMMPTGDWLAISHEHQAMARSVVNTLHDNHVGITPSLAIELVQTIYSESPADNPETTWGVVVERIIDTLMNTGEDKRFRSSVTSLFIRLKARPSYFILRVAQPLVTLACKLIGKNYIFCDDYYKTSVSRQNYEEYETQLAAEIIRIAKAKDSFILWQEVALVIASISRTSTATDKALINVAKTDPLALATLIKLEPKTSYDSYRPNLVRSPRENTRFQKRDVREGGNAGIQITHNPEHIDQALLSEYTYDDITRLDRQLNSGYLIPLREPKKLKLRDTLIVGWMPSIPHDLSENGSVWQDLSKACWFDTIARYAVMLLGSKLNRSEFRWIQGDDIGRHRQTSFMLNDWPEVGVHTNMKYNARYRYAFLNTLAWLPYFLSDRDFDYSEKYTQLPVDDAAAAHGLQQDSIASTPPFLSSSLPDEVQQLAMRNWIDACWRSQKDAACWDLLESDQWNGTGPTATHEGLFRQVGYKKHTPLAVERFATVHHMFMFPYEYKSRLMSSEDVQDFPKTIESLLTQNGKLEGSISILWLPQQLTEQGPVLYSKDHESTLIHPKEEEATIEKIGGAIVDNWLNLLVAGVLRGK